jgi:hypothetical protein
MIQFRPGDQVRLTRQFASALMSSSRTRVNWAERVGIVKRASGDRVCIIWVGNSAIDQFPIKAVERVA